MLVPTSKDKRIKNKDIPSQRTVSFLLKMDEKGRIVIPAEIRNTFGLNKAEVRLNIAFSASKIAMEIIPENGCVSVVDRIGACGAPGPGSIPGRSPSNAGKVGRRKQKKGGNENE